MNYWDKEKLNAVRQSTILLVGRDGLSNFSMSKLAKEANVSSRTIYIYYENKQDLLKKIYLSSKEKLDIMLDNAIFGEDDLFDKFDAAVKSLVEFFNHWPDEWIYLQIIQQDLRLNSNQKDNQEELVSRSLIALYEAMQADNRFIHANIEVFNAIATGPLVLLADAMLLKKSNIDVRDMDILVEASRRAITNINYIKN